MYVIAITVSLSAAYFILYALFPYFFKRALVGLTRRSILSLAIIIVLSLVGYEIAFSIADLEWGNRVLHAWGGGFMTFLVCFLVVKDSKLDINKFQFFVMSTLMVTSLGVANEIMEFFLQNYGGIAFLRGPNDTWLDLISNCVGILIASVVLVPFVGRKNED